MAGKDKHAKTLADSAGAPIDAACSIGRAGATASQIGMGVGGLVGAAAASAGSKKTSGTSDIPIGQFGWLGIGPDTVYLTGAGMMGKPKGDVLLQAALSDIESVELVQGKLSILADVALKDGRHAIFESKRQGMNASNVEVYELLRDRANGA